MINSACFGVRWLVCLGDAAVLFEGFDDLFEHLSGFVHALQQSAMPAEASGITDIPQCFLALFIERVLEGELVRQEV